MGIVNRKGLKSSQFGSSDFIVACVNTVELNATLIII